MTDDNENYKAVNGKVYHTSEALWVIPKNESMEKFSRRMNDHVRLLEPFADALDLVDDWIGDRRIRVFVPYKKNKGIGKSVGVYFEHPKAIAALLAATQRATKIELEWARAGAEPHRKMMSERTTAKPSSLHSRIRDLEELVAKQASVIQRLEKGK